MADKHKPISINRAMVLLLVLVNAIFISDGYTGDENWYKYLIISFPLLIWKITDVRREKPAAESIGSRETAAMDGPESGIPLHEVGSDKGGETFITRLVSYNQPLNN